LRTLPVLLTAPLIEPHVAINGTVWLEEIWLSKLDAMRKPGESYSDVILGLVELRGAL
jgi:hypothetical protein